MTQYSGFVIADPSGTAIRGRAIEVTSTAETGGVGLEFTGDDYGIRGWGGYALRSPQPLADEEWRPQGFEYPVYVVRRQSSLIILAPRRLMAEFLWSKVVSRYVDIRFLRVNFVVPAMVAFCASPTSEFLLTSLHGDFAGAATNLRRIALYGDEVTKTALFEEYGRHFNFYRCGLGRRLFSGLPRLKPNEQGEIVQLRSNGNISMELRNRRDACELLNVITFVMSNRWVDDWVPV